MNNVFSQPVSERARGSAEVEFLNRRCFVQNLGCLLAQTREQIISADLDESDVVTITYSSGNTRRINVAMDSYLAIIKDVVKHL